MIDDKQLKGTTTIGLVCKDGVILASEKRSTMGSFIASKEAKKIYQIDNLVGMTTAGLVGDAQILARIITVEAQLYKMRRQEPMTVKAVATLLSNILNSNRFFPYYVQLLTGGMDKNGPNIISLDAFGGHAEEKDVVATGSGSPIAYGVLEDRYSDDMSLDDGVGLAVRALHAVMKRDAASGDGMEVIKISTDKYEFVSEEDIKTIRDKLA